MKNCRETENLLPLYEEGVLSEAEKRAVEAHLADCAVCRKELADLKKARELVSHLSPLEEPPWFQQKIMARVREEAEKKRLAANWFSPLKFKVPVQIMATIVIAVLAVYIYRAGNEDVKRVLPGATPPAVETRQELSLPPAGAPPSPAAPDNMKAARKEASRDREPARQMAQRRVVPDAGEPEGKPQPISEAHSVEEKKLSAAPDKDASPADAAVPKQTAQKARDADVFEKEHKAEERAPNDAAKKKGSENFNAPAAARSMAAAPAAPLQAAVSVHVENLGAALADVEKILAASEGIITSRQRQADRIILQAAVSGAHWKDVVLKLKKLGPVEEKTLPGNNGQANISMAIEIVQKDE